MPDTLVPPTHERSVVAVVEGLVAELDAGRGPRRVTLESTLDRDLGIGSLERVELLLRLEAVTGVRVPDHVMANAGTVGDLVRALGTSGGAWQPETGPSMLGAPVSEGAAAIAPPSVRTMIDALAWYAERTPERLHVLLVEEDGRETPLTYGALWREALATAAGLRTRGVGRGECVALLLRTERAFFTSYYGTLLAGAVPVPLYPPFRADQIQEYATRQAAILRNAEARLLVTFDQAERVAGLLKPLAPSLIDVTTASALSDAGSASAAAPVPAVAADALALVQYTSGSTGLPKGVALSHANLVANIRAFGEALHISPDDVGVSWLPLYHDMGLIGAWLGMLLHGVPVVIMSPTAFLSRPSTWLRALHRHRGTITAAPNFAYDLCARKIPDPELAGLDLHAWRAALNGAEAVHAETIDRFTARLAPFGFRPEAMCPVYGLAETSLCLTVPEMNTRPRVDRIARDAFQQTRGIRPAADGESSLALVGCGRPVPGTDLRIVDDAGGQVGDRCEGRIQFRGPSATAGYYRNPDATAELIEDGWLNTGDLGYVADGHLFITGRRKDLIIAGGRNIYPQEIEDAVGGIAGIRRGCVAAFGSSDEALGTERLIVVAETRERDVAARTALERAASSTVVDLVGMPPDAVVLVRPGVIPKTSSGKIRRQATRELHERGALHRGRASAMAQWARLVFTNVRWRTGRAIGWVGAAVFTGYLWALVGSGLVMLRVLLTVAGGGKRNGRISRGWCRAVFRLGLFDVRYEGEPDLATLGPAVFVANHGSYMDALLLRAALPAGVRIAAKDALLAYPFVGGLIRDAHILTVSRGRESSADALVRAVREGGSFAIFPEGTFMRAPGLLPFRLGAFRAAVDAGRPVVPVALVGTRAAWPDGTLIVRRRPLRVVFGDPLQPEAPGWSEMVRLRDRSRACLAMDTGEPAFQYHTEDSQARASGQI